MWRLTRKSGVGNAKNALAPCTSYRLNRAPKQHFLFIHLLKSILLITCMFMIIMSHYYPNNY